MYSLFSSKCPACDITSPIPRSQTGEGVVGYLKHSEFASHTDVK